MGPLSLHVPLFDLGILVHEVHVVLLPPLETSSDLLEAHEVCILYNLLICRPVSRGQLGRIGGVQLLKDVRAVLALQIGSKFLGYLSEVSEPFVVCYLFSEVGHVLAGHLGQLPSILDAYPQLLGYLSCDVGALTWGQEGPPLVLGEGVQLDTCRGQCSDLLYLGTSFYPCVGEGRLEFCGEVLSIVDCEQVVVVLVLLSLGHVDPCFLCLEQSLYVLVLLGCFEYFEFFFGQGLVACEGTVDQFRYVGSILLCGLSEGLFRPLGHVRLFL